MSLKLMGSSSLPSAIDNGWRAVIVCLLKPVPTVRAHTTSTPPGSLSRLDAGQNDFWAVFGRCKSGLYLTETLP